MGHKKKYIKVNLVKFDKAISFQIVDQDLRITPRYLQLNFKIDDWNVYFSSMSSPRIDVNHETKEIIIYGRGHSSRRDHLKTQTIYFDDNFGRDEIFDILVKSFGEISNKILN